MSQRPPWGWPVLVSQQRPDCLKKNSGAPTWRRQLAAICACGCPLARLLFSLSALILTLYPNPNPDPNPNRQVDQYIEAFQPDIKLLFVRHPEHNLASLKKKFYAPVAGTMDAKFEALEDAYRRRETLFDEVRARRFFCSFAPSTYMWPPLSAVTLW